MERKESSIKFVGLHGHDGVGSIFDGFGYPSEHFDFAYENGLDAMAITNHGNMNSVPYILSHWDKMKKDGKQFKPILGVEAYMVESIDEWKNMLELKKKAKEEEKLDKKNKTDVVEEMSEDDLTIAVENEQETKSKKKKDPLKLRSHLVLLAKNQKGLNCLYEMVSQSYRPGNFYYYPRIDFKMLEKAAGNVVVSSACMGGILANQYWQFIEQGEHIVLDNMIRISSEFKRIFGKDWYHELQWNAIPEQHAINKLVIQASKELDIELVSTCDSHYPTPSSWRNREIYKQLGRNTKGKSGAIETIHIPTSVDEIGYELYPKNGEQMWQSAINYSKICGHEYDMDLVRESIERTHDIAFQKIEMFTPNRDIQLPSFVLDVSMSADEQLAKLCNDALVEKKLDTPEYKERLAVELDLIAYRKLSSYFLTMKAVSDKARVVGFTGPGRGSAAGALCSYLLGITQVDPVRFNLQFERFLTKTGGYPDIDYDVADRTKVVDLLIKDWGENCVVPISNFVRLKIKSLIKDVAKTMSIPYVEVNNVTNVMDSEAMPGAKKKNGVSAGVYEPTLDEYIEFSPSFCEFVKKYPDILDPVRNLDRQIRGISRHAGGVVIADDLNLKMPLVASKGVIQTPWVEGQTIRQLEENGFIKFDILALATLRMFQDCIAYILNDKAGYQKYKIGEFHPKLWDFYNKYLHPDSIDFNDELVYQKTFNADSLYGVFQFAESGMREFCSRFQPASLEDITAITSIYRPGPLDADVDKDVVEAKNKKRSKFHPIVDQVLSDSYGFIIYQEQISQLYAQLADGGNLDDGQTLRKLLTKKGTGKGKEDIEKFKTKFINGAINIHNMEQSKAEKLFENMEFFAQYGFNACLKHTELIAIYDNLGNKICDKEIENIKPGDIVKSRDEDSCVDFFTPVVKVHDNGEQEVYKFTFDNGETVECTMNHKFRTTCGKMLPISEIMKMGLEVQVENLG